MKIEMVVGLSIRALSRLPRFTTPAFDRPEERIGEGIRGFDIKGNHDGWKGQTTRLYRYYLYLAFFEDEKGIGGG